MGPLAVLAAFIFGLLLIGLAVLIMGLLVDEFAAGMALFIVLLCVEAPLFVLYIILWVVLIAMGHGG